MLAALPSCRAEMSSTPASTSPCEILKLAVPSKPKHRRAPRCARYFARTDATMEVLKIASFDSLTYSSQYRKYVTNDEHSDSAGGRNVTMCKKFALGFIAATLVCSSAVAQEVTL